MFSDVSVGGAFNPVSLNSECKSLKPLCLWQKVKPSCRYSSVKDGVKMHRRRCDMSSSVMAMFCEADEHLSGRMWEKQFDTFPRKQSVQTLLCICLRINKSRKKTNTDAENTPACSFESRQQTLRKYDSKKKQILPLFSFTCFRIFCYANSILSTHWSISGSIHSLC